MSKPKTIKNILDENSITNYRLSGDIKKELEKKQKSIGTNPKNSKKSEWRTSRSKNIW